MSDLISRSASVNALCDACNKEYPEEPCEPSECLIRKALEKAPAVDAVPVVHGRWIMKETMVRSPFAKNAYCSECLAETSYAHNYCPNCGAKMDGGEDNV